ncbi:MAG: leucine-rich repeat protein, partial [Oscillospiraceae bacterium]|nr:leucine-rich repeat protein [Oscillospiraceae bacterium]
DNVTWELSEDGTVLTISGSGPMDDWNTGYPTYDPTEGHNSTVTKVIINSGVTAIGAYAFYSFSALTDVVVPNSVTAINNRAFQDCSSLGRIYIPSSVTTIGDYAFLNTASGFTILHDANPSSAITSCCDSNSITNYVGGRCGASNDPVFWYLDNGDARIVIEGRGAMQDYGYYYTSAGDGSPSVYTTMAPWKEYKSTVTQFTINYTGVTRIGKNAFAGMTGLNYVDLITSSLTSIGYGAFRDCRGLTQVDISGSDLTIEEYAFCDCFSLSDIDLRFGVTTLKQRCFNNIAATSITIPPSVTTMTSYDYIVGYNGTTKVDGFTIRGRYSSRAHGYALYNDFTFENTYLPEITQQPAAPESTHLGQTVTLTAKATGAEDATWRWYDPADGFIAYDIGTEATENTPETALISRDSSSTTSIYYHSITATLRVPVSELTYGRGYYCVFTNNVGSDISDNVNGLNTQLNPYITNQPKNSGGLLGDTVTFSVEATGFGTLSYQWQYNKNDGNGWTDWSGKTDPTVSFKVTSGNNGNQYRCVVSSSNGTYTESEAATLTKLTDAGTCTIDLRGGDKVEITELMARTFSAAGSAGLINTQSGIDLDKDYHDDIRWFTEDGVNKICRDSDPGVTGDYTLTVTPEMRSYIARYGQTETYSSVLIHIGTPIKVTSFKKGNHPVMAGDKVTLSVTATGDTLCYQWYWSPDSGETWTASGATGNKTATLSFTAKAAYDGYYYKCVITDKFGATWEPGSYSYVELTVVTDLGALTLNLSSGAAALDNYYALYCTLNGMLRARQINPGPEDGLTSTTSDFDLDKDGSADVIFTSDPELGDRVLSVPTTGSCSGTVILTPTKDAMLSGGSIGAYLEDHRVYSSVTLNFGNPFRIRIQPKGQCGFLGNTVSFEVAALGQSLTYQWYYSKDGGTTWTPWSGKTDPSFSVKITATNNGCLYRCEITNYNGTKITSDPADLLMLEDLGVATLTLDPTAEVSVNAPLGSTIKKLLEAAATAGVIGRYNSFYDNYDLDMDGNRDMSLFGFSSSYVSYSWISSTHITGDYVLPVSPDILQIAYGGMSWTGTPGAYSSLKIQFGNPFRIIKSPSDQAAFPGKTAKFKVLASGENLTYQWQVSKDGGETWSNASGTAATFSFTAKASYDGWRYRCVVSNGVDEPLTSDYAGLGIIPDLGVGTLDLSGGPVALDLNEYYDYYDNGTVHEAILVAAILQSLVSNGTVKMDQNSGSFIGDLYLDLDKDGTWDAQLTEYNEGSWSLAALDTASVDTITYTNYSLTNSLGSRGLYSTITVRLRETVPVITTQPANVTVAPNGTATFTVAASGSGLTYQWQYSTNGSTWHNSSGTEATFSFKATSALSGRQYRCKVTNANGSVTSNAATLTVAPLPTITTQPKTQTVGVGGTATFKVVATGAESYQWQYSTNSGSTWKNCSATGYNTATFSFTTTSAMNGR